MLKLFVTNDGTGPDDVANYHWRVSVNGHTIDRGTVTGHNRAEGFRALVREIVAPGLYDEFRAVREDLKQLVADGVLEFYDFTEMDAAIAKARGDNE